MATIIIKMFTMISTRTRRCMSHTVQGRLMCCDVSCRLGGPVETTQVPVITCALSLGPRPPIALKLRVPWSLRRCLPAPCAVLHCLAGGSDELARHLRAERQKGHLSFGVKAY